MKRTLAILALVISAVAQKPQEEQKCSNSGCAAMCQSWGYCSGSCVSCKYGVAGRKNPADCSPGGAICQCTPFTCPPC